MVTTRTSQTTRISQEAFQFFINQGKIQTGADAGCLRCIDIVYEVKSSKKHMNACPGDFKTDDDALLANNIAVTSVPKRKKFEPKNNVELNVDSAKQYQENAAADVAIVASKVFGNVAYNNAIPNSLSEDLFEISWNPELKPALTEGTNTNSRDAFMVDSCDKEVNNLNHNEEEVKQKCQHITEVLQLSPTSAVKRRKSNTSRDAFMVDSCDEEVYNLNHNEAEVKQHQSMTEVLQLSPTSTEKRRKSNTSWNVEEREEILDEHTGVEMEENQNPHEEVHDLLDLSDFDPDENNVEESIVFMYKMALLHTSYRNYGTAKAPPVVRTDKESNNVIAYFQAVVQSKQTRQKLNR